ncbi:prophage maintenance system killer protein [Legionella moravica]|uniref:Prophage maintenance system killer protein n=1 Tax=Legionella moravica TaxID=39962 RepID=A0A378K1P7_9GAMM|nr:hypothetical protein [Legionella moravica]KTD37344.1 prophage maintenance system killer protein [Legionella moravica]STX63179.1 prophage maintenance system killer protein [Legionella moravica]
MELIFLTVEDVVFIQSEILSNASVTDPGKLESALKRAEQYHHYENINDIKDDLPNIIEQAASGVVDRHRLVELLKSYVFSNK